VQRVLTDAVGAAGVVELVALYGLYGLIGCMTKAFAIAPEPGLPGSALSHCRRAVAACCGHDFNR
jgi:hypothetical protein